MAKAIFILYAFATAFMIMVIGMGMMWRNRIRLFRHLSKKHPTVLNKYFLDIPTEKRFVWDISLRPEKFKFAQDILFTNKISVDSTATHYIRYDRIGVFLMFLGVIATVIISLTL